MKVSRITLVLLSLLFAAVVCAQESNHLLIPIAGDVPGANGTHFRSDISIANLRDVDQRVLIVWRPTRGGGEMLKHETLIPAQDSLHADNFVRDVLHGQGLGAVEILAIGSEPNSPMDAAGRLYATSRIWTNQPGTNATVSQTLPAVRFADVAHERVRFTGHRAGPAFRTNVGILNLFNDVTMNVPTT